MTEARSAELARLADSVLLPGFDGTALPAWLERRLARGLGGVVLFARNVADEAQISALTTEIYRASPHAVVAVDEEGGDVTRLEAAAGSSYPGNAALGAVGDLAATEAVGAAIGADLAAAGINVNLAPSADVNNNPRNPVIGVRSFGADPSLVAAHTAAWVLGHQQSGVAACVKHFPGHGDTTVDSHVGLPVLAASAEDIAEIHLPPFRAAVDAGAAAVMTGHVVLSACDSVPATVSTRILRGLLREKLGFTGAIITDALDMQGIAGPFGLTGAAVRALAAGADGLCLGGFAAEPDTLDEIRAAVVGAVLDGRLTEEQLSTAGERLRLLGRSPLAGRAAARGMKVGLPLARRALRRRGDVRLTSAPFLIQLEPAPNVAAGPLPWGPGDALSALLPGTQPVHCGPGADVTEILSDAIDRELVVVVRDAHRHRWEEDTLRQLLGARPDAVVVEMGLPGHLEMGERRIETLGAGRVNGIAAAEAMAGSTHEY